MRLIFLLLATLLTTSAWADNRLSCATLSSLMKRYRLSHFQPQPEPVLNARTARLYLKRLDPSKSLLLEAQAKAVEADTLTFLNGDAEDCRLMTQLKAEEVKWHQEMEAYVRAQMAREDFKLDESVTLITDSEKRPRPKTAAERDALRDRLLHFQIANYLASDTPLEEAKPKLVHRYELITRRIKEQTEGDFLTSLLDSYASALDPHSSYFSAEALEDFQISMGLSLEGIGAVLQQRDGFTQIHEVVKGGPADQQGDLKAKDRILAVAQEGEAAVDVVDMSLRDVVRMIRGKKGSKVVLTVLRQKPKTQRFEVTITRDKIDLKEQAAKLRWAEIKRDKETLKLAILELPSFYGGSAPGARQCLDDARALLAEANAKGADGLLLDLQHNSGGLLTHAVDLTGLFLGEGAIVGIKGTGSNSPLLDEDPAIQYRGPLVVLTSRISASASEILVGAVKDYQRGLLVGDPKTFGKGSVQNVISLPDGFGALKVTSALFYRPGGRSTQADGVETDIHIPSPIDPEVYGETVEDYPLPSGTLKPFLSDKINPKKGGYQRFKAKWIKPLAAKSAARIKASAAFKELAEELKKAQETRDLIKVGDLLKPEEKEKAKEAEEGKAEAEEPTIQAKEATEILADYVMLMRGARP
ncbi:PDZ domain-containing protein [Myxococcota bacterium]|nr:PDZ domain-containing protein [Myxococcota bacterium]MBU1430337.1 PDZ domain-containing protein [Myxococcota bacterium]MBU1896390.1 PDZ domain-containing protein [Myxococcota bacterium]